MNIEDIKLYADLKEEIGEEKTNELIPIIFKESTDKTGVKDGN